MLESLIKIKVIRLREYETYFYCYLKCRRYIIRISFNILRVSVLYVPRARLLFQYCEVKKGSKVGSP